MRVPPSALNILLVYFLAVFTVGAVYLGYWYEHRPLVFSGKPGDLSNLAFPDGITKSARQVWMDTVGVGPDGKR